MSGPALVLTKRIAVHVGITGQQAFGVLRTQLQLEPSAAENLILVRDAAPPRNEQRIEGVGDQGPVDDPARSPADEPLAPAHVGLLGAARYESLARGVGQ